MCWALSLLTSAGGRAQLSVVLGSTAPWSPAAVISTAPENQEQHSSPCILGSSCPPCHCRRLFWVRRGHSMVGPKQCPCCHSSVSDHCCLPVQSWPLSAPVCLYTPRIHGLKAACYPGALTSLWMVVVVLVVGVSECLYVSL